jgi:hypothetical protein
MLRICQVGVLALSSYDIAMHFYHMFFIDIPFMSVCVIVLLLLHFTRYSNIRTATSWTLINIQSQHLYTFFIQLQHLLHLVFGESDFTTFVYIYIHIYFIQ